MKHLLTFIALSAQVSLSALRAAEICCARATKIACSIVQRSGWLFGGGLRLHQKNCAINQ